MPLDVLKSLEERILPIEAGRKTPANRLPVQNDHQRFGQTACDFSITDTLSGNNDVQLDHADAKDSQE